MLFGSIYFAARQYFIFTTKALHYVYMPHSLELSPVDGHLNSFHILALGSSVAINANVQIVMIVLSL